MEEVHILIDYFVFSSKEYSAAYWTHLLGFDRLKLSSVGGSRYGYGLRQTYGAGCSVHIGHDTTQCCIELSGVGCRTMESLHGESFDWMQLISAIAGDPTLHISRLDVACDEKSGILNMQQLFKFTKAHRFVSRARHYFWTDGSEQQLLFGSRESDTRLRIYNKALERDVPDEHWIRAEFQFRNEACDSFIKNLQKMEYDIGRTYAGVLVNYLRYTVRAPDDNRNNDRIETTSWWRRFTGGAERLKNVTAGGLEYNLMSLNGYVNTQIPSSLKTFLLFYRDLPSFMRMVSEAQLNEKQRALLSSYRIDEGEFNQLYRDILYPELRQDPALPDKEEE